MDTWFVGTHSSLEPFLKSQGYGKIWKYSRIVILFLELGLQTSDVVGKIKKNIQSYFFFSFSNFSSLLNSPNVGRWTISVWQIVLEICPDSGGNKQIKWWWCFLRAVATNRKTQFFPTARFYCNCVYCRGPPHMGLRGYGGLRTGRGKRRDPEPWGDRTWPNTCIWANGLPKIKMVQIPDLF